MPGPLHTPAERVAVIATVFDEAASIEALLDSLLAQTRAPDQIVISDAGSRDGTREVLARYAAAHPHLVVVDAPGNRSRGRNAAIAAASAEVIATIDGGCVAEPDWLEHLLAPLAEGATWVAGFYRPEGRTLVSTCVGLVMVYVREEVVEGDFLPSARSMAFRRSAWDAVGGFPEHLEFAEDTYFDQALLDAGNVPRFAGEAVVRWHPPPGFAALARTMYRWGHGDGEAGLRGTIYRRLALFYGGTAAAAAVLAFVRPWLGGLALLPAVAEAVYRVRHKFRWAAGPLKYLYLPAAHLVARVASLIGFLRGRPTWRRSRR